MPPFFPEGEQPLWSLRHILEATALMFVAYTGCGRIAMMGEEVREPRHTIPTMIIVTLGVSVLLYVGVGLVALMTGGAEEFLSVKSRRNRPPPRATPRRPP